MGTRVWVATRSDEDGDCIEGVYLTEEEARNCCQIIFEERSNGTMLQGRRTYWSDPHLPTDLFTHWPNLWTDNACLFGSPVRELFLEGEYRGTGHTGFTVYGVELGAPVQIERTAKEATS